MIAPPSLAGLLRDESGQDLIEYALIIAVMGLALVASMNGLANSISNFFNRVGNSL